MIPTTLNRKRILYASIIVIVLVAIPLSFFVMKGQFKIPSQSLFNKPSVALKTTYENPFKKETQYVNPFQKYKNPFIVNR